MRQFYQPSPRSAQAFLCVLLKSWFLLAHCECGIPFLLSSGHETTLISKKVTRSICCCCRLGSWPPNKRRPRRRLGWPPADSTSILKGCVVSCPCCWPLTARLALLSGSVEAAASSWQCGVPFVPPLPNIDVFLASLHAVSARVVEMAGLFPTYRQGAGQRECHK